MYRNPNAEDSGDSSRSRSTRSTRSPSPELAAAVMNHNQNPPPYQDQPPQQINMDQLVQALATLTQQGLNTQGNVNALANAVHAQVAHPPAARPAPLPNLGPKTFAELDLSGGTESSKISKLCAWESAVMYNITSMDGLREDLPLERVVAGILGSLKGECQAMSQGMDPARYSVGAAHNLNVPRRDILLRFFSDLSNILLGASVPEKAYSLFRQRKQKKGEAIHPYHAELGVLYRKAFPVAWNQPENQRALIRHFLDNLWDRSLAYDVNINQPFPGTYPEALQLLEQRHGAWERYRMAYGEGAGPNFLGPRRNEPAVGGGNHGGAEAMDVDALRRRGRGQRRGAGAVDKGKGKNVRPQPQGNRREAAPKAQPRNQNGNERGCYNCGDKEHRVRDCPRKIAALSRGRRTEEDEEDNEPEVFSYEREPTSESEDDDWHPDREVAALCIAENKTKYTQPTAPINKAKAHLGTQGDGSGTVTMDGKMRHIPKNKWKEVANTLKEAMKKDPGLEELQEIVKDAFSGKEQGRGETC